MADDKSTPPKGAAPPKPGDAPKVQPKKETVRISLPPKPSSSATIKLPSVPGGAKPAGKAPVAQPAPAAPAPAKPGAAPPPPKPPAAPKPGAPTVARIGAPGGASGAAAPAAAPSRPAPPAAGSPSRRGASAAAKKISPIDTGMAVAAGILGLGAVVSILLLLTLK